MTEEYRNGYARGLRDGANRTLTTFLAPNWIDAAKRVPYKNGTYYAIEEFQQDFPFAKAGTIYYDLNAEWCDGAWWNEDEHLKILYWAEKLEILPPIRLEGRKVALPYPDRDQEEEAV